MPDPSGRALGDVLTDIAHNVERVVRAQVYLEAASVLESATAMARGVGLVAVGGLLALVATLLLLLSAVARLLELMSPWEAFLLGAAGTGLLSVAIVAVGLRTLRRRAVKARSDQPQLERDPWPTPPLT